MKKLNEMNIKEKIGQLIFAGFPGTVYDEHVRELIEDYKLGNIILFARNYKDLKQIHDLNYKLHQEIMANTKVMPFINIDQEGGMVTRIMDGATFLPGAMSIGATEANNAYLLGRVSGEELRALGININLAPTLDVNNNPLNPVIGVRAYGDKPEFVSRYGINFIKGVQESGVIATAKHFPGHGDTNVDSHYSLPTIKHSKERIEKIELVPFKNAIKAGVESIMSAHVFFPAYEEGNLPATLSKKVMTDLLRNELGFEGLIVSDCMEMKAISDNYTTPKGVLMGLLAGLDIVLVSQTLKNQKDTFELLYKAVEDGTFPLELLDEKVARVLKYKEKVYPVMEEFFYKKSFEEKHQLITKKESKDLASKVVDNSLTKVRGKDFYPAKKTLVIATEPFATTIAEDIVSTRSIINLIKAKGLPFETRKISVRTTDEEIEEILKDAKFFEQVLVCTYNAKFHNGQVKLINELYKQVEDLFVISTRNPYDIQEFDYVENYLCVYEYTPNSVSTIVKYFNKEITPTGKLPISLNIAPEIGASLYVGLSEYPVEKNIKYLDLLKEVGIRKVFISAHIPEMHSGFMEELDTVIKYANELDFEIILDVSKPMLENFEIPKIYSLRLDWGFSDEETVELYNRKEFILELNASTISEAKLRRLSALGIDLSKIRISQNFYPKPDTGLSFEKVLKTNEMLKKFGLKVMGYIPASGGKRPPLYKGIPTLEAHRDLRLDLALQEMKLLGFSEIIFSDAYASKEELEFACKFDFSKWQLPVKLEVKLTMDELNHLKKTHRNRMDNSDLLIRSAQRVNSFKIKAQNTIDRKFLDLTMDNENNGRYQGEIGIILESLKADKGVNVIGKVIATKELIEGIKPSEPFVFIIEE